MIGVYAVTLTSSVYVHAQTTQNPLPISEIIQQKWAYLLLISQKMAEKWLLPKADQKIDKNTTDKKNDPKVDKKEKVEKKVVENTTESWSVVEILTGSVATGDIATGDIEEEDIRPIGYRKATEIALEYIGNNQKIKTIKLVKLDIDKEDVSEDIDETWVYKIVFSTNKQLYIYATNGHILK